MDRIAAHTPAATSAAPPAQHPVHGDDEELLVGDDELFFSTTDRRGVIRSGNSVFERISGYPLEELVGAPHNLVRHPLMPAGAFALLWERLLDGRPAAAYVRNRARSGATYWVFATVTPLGDGFLSVRMAPRGPRLATVRALYEQVRAFEVGLAGTGGWSRAQVARAGADEIERQLRELRYASYDDFMLDALPAEVAARDDLVRSSFARPGGSGPLARILQLATSLDETLAGLTARLDGYAELAAALVPAGSQVLQDAVRLEHSVDAARRVSAERGAGAPVLLNVATVMAGPMQAAVDALEALAPELGAVAQDVLRQRFRIALTTLHTQMVAAFAAEAVDGLAPASALAEVPALCDALHDDAADLAARTRAANRALHEVAAGVEAAAERLQQFRQFLGQWRILVLRHRLTAAVADQVGPIDTLLDAGHEQLDRLRGLARACEQSVVHLDPVAVDEALYAIRSSATYA